MVVPFALHPMHRLSWAGPWSEQIRFSFCRISTSGGIRVTDWDWAWMKCRFGIPMKSLVATPLMCYAIAGCFFGRGTARYISDFYRNTFNRYDLVTPTSG